MYTYTTLMPQAGDTPPVARMSGDTIPVLDLNPDWRGLNTIQFDSADPGTAVAWLDHLADEASSLAAKIRIRQQQAERLLAAVEASPGSEG